MRNFAAMAICSSLVGLCSSPLVAAKGDAEEPVTRGRDVNEAPVHTHTYLQARTGDSDRLARFIERNWFAMDARAVNAGLFRSYRLLENADPNGQWDLIVEVVYNDACGYACIAEEFEQIRTEHRVVPVEGKVLSDLGSIIKTEQFQERM